jgi:hypothetical protein
MDPLPSVKLSPSVASRATEHATAEGAVDLARRRPPVGIANRRVALRD